MSELLPFKVTPWAHQLEAIQIGVGRPAYGLFHEPGCGKTLTACCILRNRWKGSGGLQPTLILAPPIVLANWQRELAMHTDLPKERVVVLSGAGKKRLEQLRLARQKFKDRFVAVTNYEGLNMPALYDELQRWRPQCLVVDESHRAKDIKAKRTKQTIQLADQAEICRLILTGTPVLNSPMDLFAQYRIMDRGEALGRNFFVFRATFFVDKNAYMPKQRYFPDWRPTEEGMARLNKIIQATASRAEKKDCLDLPPLVRKVIEVELSPEQRRIYDEMKQDFVTYLEGKACVAQLAITKALRLQQIVSGHVALEGEQGEKSVRVLEGTPRAAALKELLGELGPYHKVLVWAAFREDYRTARRCCDELGLPYVEVHGDVSQREKEAAVDSFEKDPAIRVLVGHPRSGGVGINLIAASYAIFYSRSFSLEDREQATARNYRGGSEIHEKITLIDLVAKGTIDEVVLAALEAKTQMSLDLLRKEVVG